MYYAQHVATATISNVYTDMSELVAWVNKQDWPQDWTISSLPMDHEFIQEDTWPEGESVLEMEKWQ